MQKDKPGQESSAGATRKEQPVCDEKELPKLPSERVWELCREELLEDLYGEACGAVRKLAQDGDDSFSAARLYSDWCFRKLIALLGKRVGQTSQGKASDLTISLREGRSSGARFLDPAAGKSVTLTYRLRNRNSEAADGEPDAVLLLERQERNLSCQVIFLVRSASNPGPAVIGEEEAETLSRYRKASLLRLSSSPHSLLEEVASGAYLLIPPKDPGQEPVFFGDGEAGDTGVLPFLPRVTEQVEAVLDRALSLLPKADLKRPALSPELEEELQKADWSSREVLVGTVRTPEQLQFNLKKKGYYVPEKFLSEKLASIQYIALFEETADGKLEIVRYGEVTGVRKIERGKIPVPMRKNADPDEPYHYFTVKSWELLEHPVMASQRELGRPQLTNRFLLEHCSNAYLLFSVKTEKEYRLAKEIGRVLEDLENAGDAALYPLNETKALVLFEGCFTVVTDRGEVLERIPMTELQNALHIGFEKIKSFLKRKGAEDGDLH